ncbi:hypothetical protein [Nostoc sp. UHCC 0251]|uniref:hypothetical protein n=1 Tax=Nostoc sp. UHCC 0251 TaxID=3110240 RepID=UPI002B1F00D6|nr:hypothetical protein [Nostoc sp. UHCC 0251]MEA5625014.1 hypothetical protein [Nostoc sp. UHCC 0251]
MNIIKRLHMPSITRILFLLFLLLLAMLLAIFPVWSGISVSPQPTVTSADSENLYLAGDNIIVKASEVINDDVYLTGDRITIDGTVKGDAVLAGRQIISLLIFASYVPQIHPQFLGWTMAVAQNQTRSIIKALSFPDRRFSSINYSDKPTSARQHYQLDHLFPRLGCVLLVVDKTRSRDS